MNLFSKLGVLSVTTYDFYLLFRRFFYLPFFLVLFVLCCPSLTIVCPIQEEEAPSKPDSLHIRSNTVNDVHCELLFLYHRLCIRLAHNYKVRQEKMLKDVVYKTKSVEVSARGVVHLARHGARYLESALRYRDCSIVSRSSLIFSGRFMK